MVRCFNKFLHFHSIQNILAQQFRFLKVLFLISSFFSDEKISVGQDVQIPTVLAWKIFQKLYIFPNIMKK